MDVREKLVELLKDAQVASVDKCHTYKACNSCPNNGQGILCRVPFSVDHLIDKGVTVQEEAKLYWKPVNPGEWNLTCSACDSHLGCREGAKYCPECGAKFVYPKAIMPQPPKGE